MPYSVGKDTTACPTAKPWAVKKQADGKVMGCHATEADAKKQLSALYAQEQKSLMTVETPEAAPGTQQHRIGVRLALIDGALEYRDGENGNAPLMRGHFAVFNEWTEINSIFEGRFLESIAPGAFTKTISERRDKIKVLFQHGRDSSTGARPLGTVEKLNEDQRGAYYEVRLFDTMYVNELLPALRAGQLGASFKFEVMREDIDREPVRSTYNPEGIQERVIKEIRLFEFGPVTFPAYEGATAGLRSITDNYAAQAFADFSEADPEGMQRFVLENLGLRETLRELIVREREALEDRSDTVTDDDGTVETDDDGERVSSAPWDGSAGRFTDEQYARSCVYDRGKCGGEWASKPAKTRYSLPIREPGGALNKNGVHAAAGRIGSVSGGCDAAASAAKASLRGAYKQIGEDPPENLKSLLGWDMTGRDDATTTSTSSLAPPVTTPDDARSASTSEPSAATARSRILINEEDPEPWLLQPNSPLRRKA